MEKVYVITINSQIKSDGFRSYNEAEKEFNQRVGRLQVCGYKIEYKTDGYVEMKKETNGHIFCETLDIHTINIL